ncbi:adenylate kinase [Gaertneriomyces sp. JEL0708]|nr:adenylate kinase [Gaertneriomyces sp. JEL0708]
MPEISELSGPLVALPLPSVQREVRRPCYFIVGKPGCGTRELAQKLAQELNALCLSPDVLVAQAVEDASNKWHESIVSSLTQGDAIEPSVVRDIIEDAVSSDAAAFQGYVVDGLSASSDDLRFMIRLLENHPAHHKPILLNVTIPDEDLMRNCAAQWIDSETGIVYPGAQVVLSRKRWAEKKDGSDEEDEDEENGDEKSEAEDHESDEEDEEGDESASDEDDDERQERKKRKRGADLPTTELLIKKAEWKTIPMDVLERLIKRPEDSPENTANRLSSMPPEEVNKVFDKVSPYQIVSLDASGPSDELLPAALEKLSEIGYGVYTKASLPKVLKGPDGGFRGASDNDIVRYFATSNLDSYEPARTLSVWGKHCPITFHQNGRVHECDTLENVVVFKGKIYVFAKEEYIPLFLANPEKYIATPPSMTNLKICLLGGPNTGKTTQSDLIANAYRLAHVNLDAELERLLVEGDVQGDWRSIKDRILMACRSGGTVPVDVEIELVQLVIEREASNGKSNGWVLDGYPRTTEQAKSLAAAGLIPDHVVTLRSDINSESIRTRGRITPEAGSGYTPAISVLEGRYFSDLYDGFQSNHKQILSAWTEVAPKPEQSEEAVDGESSEQEHQDVDDSIRMKTADIDAEKTVQSVLSSIMAVVDPFLSKSEIVPPKSLGDMPPNPPLGLTRNYCPVILGNRQVLVPGAPNMVVQYQSQYYYLSSVEAQATFVSEPQTFVRDVRIPPPRILIVGIQGSGRRSFVEKLGQHAKESKREIQVVHFEQLLRDYIDHAPVELREELEAALKEDTPSPEMGVEVLRNLFESEPYKTTGFILSMTPGTTSKAEAEAFIQSGFAFDAVIHLSVDPENAAIRVIKNKRKNQPPTPQAPQPEGNDEDGREDDEFDNAISLAERQQTRLSDTLTTVSSQSNMPVFEIDANRPLRPILAQAKEKLRPYLDFRESLLSFAYKVTIKEAEKLLELGVKDYSQFLRYCPVTLSAGVQTTGVLPAVYGNQVYWFKDKAARELFIINTQTYASLPAPSLPVHPTICIIGPPKAGKTTAAKAAAKDLGIVYLDIPKILQTLLNSEEITNRTYQRLKVALETGQEVPDDVVLDAVRVVTAKIEGQRKGWILDGWPSTKSQAEGLQRLGVIPHVVFSLEIDERAVVARCAEDYIGTLSTGQPELNAADLVEAQYQQFLSGSPALQSFYATTYDNMQVVAANISKWSLKTTICKTIRQSIKRRQEYHDAVSQNAAAPVNGVGINLINMEKRIGKFGDYCPVSFVEKEALVGGALGTKCMAEYQRLFYRLAGEDELAAFLSNPTRYVNSTVSLPPHLPRKKTATDVKEMFPKGLELQGYCPVMFGDGDRSLNTIVPGDPNLIVEYEDKLYSFCSEEALMKFMSKPWLYTSLTLPKKLPPRHAPININALPIVGYLEQTVATIITDALHEVGKLKPKYPFKSAEESAVEYLALYLKAHNKKAPTWLRESYSKRLTQYRARCELIEFLHDSAVAKKTVDAPERDKEFDARMSEFIELGTGRKVLPPLRGSGRAM